MSDRFKFDHSFREVDVFGCMVRINEWFVAPSYVYGNFSWKFYIYVVREAFGASVTSGELNEALRQLDHWCRQNFGNPAVPIGDGRTSEQGTWYRTEGTFRFRNKAHAAAFKLAWT